MIPTIPFIQDRFHLFNRLYFNSILPDIPIRLSRARTFLGKLVFRKQRTGIFFQKTRHTDFLMRINAAYDLPEDLLEDVILHEMIHYYIAYQHLPDASAHGPLFREHMKRINALGNRHITISHRPLAALTPAPTAQRRGTGQRPARTRVVCIVRFADGRTGIKVLPKQVPAILAFDQAAPLAFPISTLEYYLSADPFFAPYPTSRALRIYLLTTPKKPKKQQATAPAAPAPDPLQLLNVALAASRPILLQGTQLRLSPTANTHLHW